MKNNSNKMKTIEDIQERIHTHKVYAKKCLRMIRTNPSMRESASNGLAIALNQIEELEWVMGIEHDYETVMKLEHQEKHYD